MNILDSVADAIEWSRSYRPESSPPVFPGWLEPSEVSYVAGRIGAVTHRGETVRPGGNVGGVE